jgi:hypothetical protein
MKKIIFNHNFVNGWGDTFLCIFDIINCIDFIRSKFNDYEIIYIINNPYNSVSLEKVLNLEFLNHFVHSFKILNSHETVKINNGKIYYDNITYQRIYSGRNNDVNNNIPGTFDVFIPEQDEKIDVPFIDFTYNDIDSRPKDFNIFNLDLVNNCNNFVKNNLNEKFDSIFYRALSPINVDKMNNFVNILENTLDLNKTYFMCSNSSVIKEKILQSKINIKLFRDLNNHNKNHVPNGYVKDCASVDDALFAVTEMLILSKGSHIYYSGEINNISLFNWYPINIKKVKLINL